MKVGAEAGGGSRTGSFKAAGRDRFAVSGPVIRTDPSCYDACRCPSLELGSDPSLAVALEDMGGRDNCLGCDCGGTSAVFDRGILDDLATMLDDEELDAYLALLEPTVAPRIEKLERDLEAGNLTGLLETAHALAGGAACYGLVALSDAARVVEHGARAAQVEILRQAVAAAAGLLDSSLTAVLRWRCRFGYDRAAAQKPVAA